MIPIVKMVDEKVENKMTTDHREEVESQADNLIECSEKLLLSEARAMALLVFDTFFPCINDQDDISCWNCKSYENGVCGGKRLDFQGVIQCMLKKVIHATDHPTQPQHLRFVYPCGRP
jgi:hypothetical protein